MVSSMDRVAPEKLAIHQPSMFLPWVIFERETQMKKLPEVELLRHTFSYDADSGILRWKIKPSQAVGVGDIAGNVQHGYVVVQFGGKSYKAHRLIWTMHYGDIGDLEIDHINLNRSDNRLCNLRLATKNQNQRNARARKDNKYGLKGVSLSRAHNKYKAQIQTGDGRLYLGLFDTPELAHHAYLEAAKRLHGEFANA